MASADGQFSLSLPADFVGQNGQSQQVQVNVSSAPLPTEVAGLSGATPMLALSVDISLNGNPIGDTVFSDPLTWTITYDPAQLAAAGIQPQSLRMYLINSQTGAVTPLQTQVDPVAHTITAKIPHLTVLVLGVTKTFYVYLPSVMASATSGW